MDHRREILHQSLQSNKCISKVFGIALVTIFTGAPRSSELTEMRQSVTDDILPVHQGYLDTRKSVLWNSRCCNVGKGISISGIDMPLRIVA